jgi:hypothetical protein
MRDCTLNISGNEIDPIRSVTMFMIMDSHSHERVNVDNHGLMDGNDQKD